MKQIGISKGTETKISQNILIIFNKDIGRLDIPMDNIFVLQIAKHFRHFFNKIQNLFLIESTLLFENAFQRILIKFSHHIKIVASL